MFELIFWAGIIIEMVIRAPISRRQRAEPKAEQRVSRQEQNLLGLLFVGMFFLPLIQSLTHWLDFADYTLPAWAGWAGTGLLAFALLIFWRSHVDLGLNWSPSLEIRREHKLITHGIFRFIRHPMYASQWIWVFAQPLLLQNWIAGFANLVIFIPFYVLRVRAEEQMMMDAFGGEYRDYVEKTGAVFPKFTRKK